MISVLKHPIAVAALALAGMLPASLFAAGIQPYTAKSFADAQASASAATAIGLVSDLPGPGAHCGQAHQPAGVLKIRAAAG